MNHDRVIPETERIRTHLTPMLLRLGKYEETGDPREIALAVEALGRALTAAVIERCRADDAALDALEEKLACL